MKFRRKRGTTDVERRVHGLEATAGLPNVAHLREVRNIEQH